jgi:hypothetical protein
MIIDITTLTTHWKKLCDGSVSCDDIMIQIDGERRKLVFVRNVNFRDPPFTTYLVEGTGSLVEIEYDYIDRVTNARSDKVYGYTLADGRLMCPTATPDGEYKTMVRRWS